MKAADRLRMLEDTHRQLNEKVDRLERRAYLTPGEQSEVTEMKKLKLSARDEIRALKAQIG